MKYFDDAGNQYNADIIECVVNGIKAAIEDGKAVRFKIEPVSYTHLGNNKRSIKYNIFCIVTTIFIIYI